MASLMIADNDVVFTHTLHTLAQRHGHHIITVSSGRDLLDALELHSPDLCVIEVLIPEMDGLELIPEIRRRYPHVKILAMCEGGVFGSKAAPLFLHMAQCLGADGRLEKPFALETFLALVHELLGVQFHPAYLEAQLA